MKPTPPPRNALLERREQPSRMRLELKRAEAPPPCWAEQPSRLLLRIATAERDMEATPPPLPAREEAFRIAPAGERERAVRFFFLRDARGRPCGWKVGGQSRAGRGGRARRWRRTG